MRELPLFSSASALATTPKVSARLLELRQVPATLGQERKKPTDHLPKLVEKSTKPSGKARVL
jgi:hypothetical protein